MTYKRKTSSPITLLLATALLTVAFSASCDQRSKAPGNIAGDDLQKQVSDTLQQYVLNGKSIDELKKLHQFEYHVFTLPIENSPAKIEGVLNKMGEEKWDCYHIEKVSVVRDEKKQGRFLFFCKRKFDTPLRYVPQSILGR